MNQAAVACSTKFTTAYCRDILLAKLVGTWTKSYEPEKPRDSNVYNMLLSVDPTGKFLISTVVCEATFGSGATATLEDMGTCEVGMFLQSGASVLPV